MKKYQRLVLLIVSLISLLLFLTYRHQYYRLRHVLEVFNFFGTPCNVTELQRSQGVLMEHDWGPRPMWQEITSKNYVFSAFLTSSTKLYGIGVRALKSAPFTKCSVLFEDQQSSVIGQLRLSKLTEDDGYMLYMYSCEFSAVEDKEPFSVLFKNGRSQVAVQINNNLWKGIESFNTTVCVTPNEDGWTSKKALLEFFSYHNLIGIDSFIVYYQTVPHRWTKLLKNLSNILNFWVTFYSYNLPPDIPWSFTNLILHYDCKFRTKTHTKLSVLINLTDYIVPTWQDQDNHPQRDRLPIKPFCIDHDSELTPLILENFVVLDDFSYSGIVKLNRNNNHTFQKFDAIHRYAKCENGLKTVKDYTMTRYRTDLVRNTLWQLFIHNEF